MLISTRSYDLSHCDFPVDLCLILQRIYQSRGVNSQQHLNRQLNCLPSPKRLLGIDLAVARLLDALSKQQKILVLGDFDADGATSVALMLLALNAMGFRHVDFLVPNRFDYGYGLTPEIVQLAAQKEPHLIITVDNGISSIDGVVCANDLGIDVIITDHHLPGVKLPDAVAIVNPNQLGCPFPSKNLAGVGVAFYLLSALRAALREQSWFALNNLSEPTMATWLDLVALGTVADVVPLDPVNRALVHQGLLRIRAGHCRPGIKALLRIAAVNADQLVAADLGFVLGPRLNAAGRLDDISLGIQCLITHCPEQALHSAQTLDELNRDRKIIEHSMQAEARSIIEHLPLNREGDLPVAFCLYRPDWHQGVVGLLASRIKEKYHRPVVAFARDDNGMLKGSMRSIPGLHIRDTLDALATRHPGLITKFGGHSMAAGLSLPESKLQDFEHAFQRQVMQSVDETHLRMVMMTDGSLESADLTMAMAKRLREAGPWGQLFPEPCFEGVFVLLQQRIVAEKHLKLVLAHRQAQQDTIDAIYFNVDTDHWPNDTQHVRCVYRLDINEFRGQTNLQLLVQYMEPCEVMPHAS